MKTAVLVVLAFAVGALAAPNQYSTYKQPYSQDYYKTNDYQPQTYNSYDTSNYGYNQPAYQSDYSSSYKQPSYNDYSKPSYNDYSKPSYNDYSKPAYNDYSKPSYNDYSKPAYNDYSKPSYNDYSKPAYNDYSKPSYNDYQTSSYSQPDYSSSSYGYQNNYQTSNYGYQQKSCSPLEKTGLIVPQNNYKNKIAYVADDDVTAAYCGGKDNANQAIFYVRSYGKCALIDKRPPGLEEALIFSCNHQTGYWDLLAGSDTKYQAISQYNIICGTAGDSVEGCGTPATDSDNTADDLSWFYPYNIGYKGYYKK